ncbi:5-(carboxyamino)imidazole ribonucleotide synthase [Roseicyclus sp. F158]|uniref:N5-carboxyaminoimidazole ribonucleotide synthase n=1 Tax=Tropicimonas omnivorans TaxID=3075590 RepID=A0ABU3DFU0_9RHOB|nr:5-(carboxyamino)imidazole ribonucleotide synthase [Roseicyclus sp. F158]MDT0682424.1 5-(carboxyamino)imidazole ribonucleotide synthase [Roseicyclus sp. F158]
MTEMLPQGAVIGILGGGQLGRMLSVAAARLGYRTCIYDPAGNPPASHVANAHVKAGWDDVSALRDFAAGCDVITYEFENIPAEALDLIGAETPIYPGRKALEVSSDRLTEKRFLEGLGLAVAPHAPVQDARSLREAIAEIGSPAILKTRRLGYDGKGQARIDGPEAAEPALEELAGVPAILEGFVKFACEISVIAARGADGQVSCFDPGMNVHRNGILHQTTVPAPIASRLNTDAVILAGRILNALDYVGVLGVELFVTADGLVVNEIAPRVHNSGHWTQNGCAVDQFEQHIRAIAGWPLGDGSRHSDVVMENLIGDDIGRLPAMAAETSAALHLYGKAEARPGRKMGHVNRVTPMRKA